MNSRMLIIAWGVGSLLLCLLLWWAFSAWVTSPAAAIQSRIDSMNASLERRRVDIDRAAGVNDRIESIAARTLGSTTEAVDHALRSRLAALAEAAAVTDVRVGTSPPVEVESPGRREFKGSQRSLGKEPDFMLVGATVAARGTWSGCWWSRFRPSRGRIASPSSGLRLAMAEHRLKFHCNFKHCSFPERGRRKRPHSNRLPPSGSPLPCPTPLRRQRHQRRPSHLLLRTSHLGPSRIHGRWCMSASFVVRLRCCCSHLAASGNALFREIPIRG